MLKILFNLCRLQSGYWDVIFSLVGTEADQRLFCIGDHTISGSPTSVVSVTGGYFTQYWCTLLGFLLIGTSTIFITPISYLDSSDSMASCQVFTCSCKAYKTPNDRSSCGRCSNALNIYIVLHCTFSSFQFITFVTRFAFCSNVIMEATLNGKIDYIDIYLKIMFSHIWVSPIKWEIMADAAIL